MNIEKTINNLKKNNIDAVFIDNIEYLKEEIDKIISEGMTVTLGGSMTLFETKIYDYLKNLANDNIIKFLDRYQENISRDKINKIYREAFFSDVYFMSSNAITEEGELYNVDGNGNRVSALIYGPKQVIIIAGTNKIVKNREEAIKRVENIAAPLNAKRLKLKTPCTITGTCNHCMSEDRICRSFVFSGKQRNHGRIKVILLNGNYGY